MITKLVEVTNMFNWGKFMVAKFDEAEWAARSRVDGHSVIGGRGWDPIHLLVLDLQTGEGAVFRPGGLPSADLEKHAIWVCPMYAVFLEWLYKRPEHWNNIASLPDLVELSKEETKEHTAMYGYRRPGPSSKERAKKAAETAMKKVRR